MGNKLFNIPYFFREAATLIKKDLSSNLMSAFSLVMIFFILTMTAGFGVSMKYMADALEAEAEISVYYDMDADYESIISELEVLDGVYQVTLIDALEAKDEMSRLMGDDSRILALFEYNPFSPYLEVGVDLERSQDIAETARVIKGVNFVRDNKEVLDKLKDISSAFNIAGIFVFTAVGAATIVLTSHIIRQGVYLNRDSIGTLKLLGAPDGFIYLPFIMNGVLLSLVSGIVSIGITIAAATRLYSGLTGTLPFLVLPDYKLLIFGLALFTLIASFVLGILGSIIGIKSTKPKK